MRHKVLRPLLAAVLALGLGSTLNPTVAAQPNTTTESEDSATARANAEQEAIDNAAEAAATPAPGREDLEPAEPGFDDNTIDNGAGADWHPTADPEATITPGQMRSDTEDIPGGFTKEEADRAEVQEAAERQAQQDRAANPLARALAAAPVNCTTYWPSPYKVCGAIREKYDAIGGPTSFLTWPKSDELGVPDGVGRRNEFVNGFIYWHPTTGAHPVTTHFSTVWARNGWEAGRLGYPTTDELGLSDGIGRKQSFQRGHIYGSLAGLASIEGLIYDKWVTTGAEGGPLGYPTADEAGTPDGVGRFSAFVAGLMYWHPTHGAHPVSGDILFQWGYTGYEKGPWGYPAGDPVQQEDGWYRQKFAVGHAYGLVANGLADLWNPNGNIDARSKTTEKSSFKASSPNAGGNDYTDQVKFTTEDASGNKVTLRRGFYDGKDKPDSYPAGPFGYDKIYHKHNIFSLYSMKVFIENSSPVRKEGTRRIYENKVYRQECAGPGVCKNTGEWFEIRMVYEPKEFGDPGEEKGVLTMYPLKKTGQPVITSDQAPDWFSTDLPTF